MKRVAYLLLVLAGCGTAATPSFGPPVPPPRAWLPPAPSTWPRYPRFPAASCWTRPPIGGMQPAAPSFARVQHASPQAIARRMLARLGDGRFVHSTVFAPPPPITRQHTGYFGPGRHPPSNALWAYLGATKSESFTGGWELALVRGALRDELCAAGGRPLVGWSVAGHVAGVSDGTYALGQRFPNPSPRAFRARLAATAKRFGFRVVSLRLLRPLQLAPLVIIETDRDRKSFVADVSSIVKWLDPRNGGAITFEGFLLEARDKEGAFVGVENVYRGEVEGGQWSADPCSYPYLHLGTLSSNPC